MDGSTLTLNKTLNGKGALRVLQRCEGLEPATASRGGDGEEFFPQTKEDLNGSFPKSGVPLKGL